MISDGAIDALEIPGRTLAAAVATVGGTGVTVRGERPAGGGSINRTSVLELSDGSHLFLKANDRAPAGLFREEARGLLALAAAEGPRVPRPLALFTDGGARYLLLEHIDTGRRAAGFDHSFGVALAQLHRSARADHCGFSNHNHIGATEQRNTLERDWHRFFGVHRLEFQMALARDRGYGDAAMHTQLTRLVQRLPELIPVPDHGGPSLLHGDLWSGNYLVGADGAPVLIDPAVYYGHREADLAMTELFGGFGEGFYRGYHEYWPLEPGYAERRDIYNLYHLLNHLNLFGSSYLGSCMAILRRFQ